MDIAPLAISINEACKAANVGRTTLYGAIGRGELKVKKLGRRSILMIEDVSDWIKGLPESKSNRDAA